MKKKIFLLVIFMLGMMLCCNVEAITEITSFAESANAEKSDPCTENNGCANSEDIYSNIEGPVYGIRVSIIDGYGVKKADTYTKNFWATGGMKEKIIKYYTDGNNKTNSYTIDKVFNVYVKGVGLPSIGYLYGKDNPYEEWFKSLDETKIQALISNLGEKDAYKMKDYYLKIEPIFVVHEKLYSLNYYDAGTAREIMDALVERTDNENPENSYGSFYVSGGTNYYIAARWNVIRNYIVSMYFDCNQRLNSRLTNRVACYDNKTYGGLKKYQNNGSNNKIPELNNLYKQGNGLGVGYIKISDYIQDTCQSAFKDNRADRIALYKKWEEKGEIYRNLLNFNIHNAEEACDNPTEDYCNSLSSSSECLIVNNNTKADDWSCYNSTHNYNGEKGYCLVSFGFEPDPAILRNSLSGGYTLLGNDFTKAGQFIFKNDFLGKAILKQSCIYEQDLSDNMITMGKYEDYVSDLRFNDLSLTFTKTPEEQEMRLECKSHECEGSIEATYELPSVYVQKISGKECNDTSLSSCISIGKGIISRFNSVKDLEDNSKSVKINGTGYLKMPFEIKFNKKNLNDISSNTCVYSVQPEIIEYDNKEAGDLELEFRIIDTANPFAGKSGKTRATKTNWCEIKDDGTLNCSGVSSDNKTIEENITNKNNSYNKTKDGAKYTITLTPSTIKKIKDYNKQNSYDDFKFICDEEGNNCESLFLRKYEFVQ